MVGAPDLSTLSRGVNVERARIGRALLERTGSSAWLFHCECGSSGCRAEVELNLEAFDRACGAGELVLAPGHEVTRARAGRREARRLVEESAALVAQAEQIVRHLEQHRLAPR